MLKDKYGNTPLWTAVFNSRGNYDVVKQLIKAGSNPFLKNNFGKSPFDFAKQIKDNKLAELLEKSNFQSK